MKQILMITLTLLIADSLEIFAQKEGEPAPDFEVNLLDGGDFKLSEQEGKVVLIFFFGNTCTYCLAAGPSVETKIYQVFSEDNSNFTAIGVDTWDTSSSENSVNGFKNTTGISFPLGLKGGSIAASYKSTYDRLMVIDSDGILAHKGLVAARNDINNAVAAIQESLAVTGNSEMKEGPQLNVYPNPASDILQFESGEIILGFVLFDVTGKKVKESVYSRELESSRMEIAVHDLEPGVYFYSIQTRDSSSTGKVLIQR